MANLSNINGKFVVDTAGNIGVGTLIPRSDANTTNISIQSSGTARLFVNNTGASGKEYAIYSSANGDFGIFDYGAVSARLVINSAGNATFAGEVVANGYLKLQGQVSPQIFMTSSTAGTPNWTMIARTDGYFLLGRSGVSNDFYFTPDGDATLAGNIGIGYAVQTNIRTYVYDNSADYGLVVQQDGAGIPFQVSSAGSLRMIVANNGNVGIGVVPNAPANGLIQLDIGDNGCGMTSRQNNELILQANANYSTYAQAGVPATRINLTNSGEFHFLNAPAGTAIGDTITFIERMRIDSLGNVGIGVVPKTGGPTWQHVQFGGTGNIIARQSDTSLGAMFANNYYINSSNVDSAIQTGEAARVFMSAGDIRFDNAQSVAANAQVSFDTRMKILSNGNVGIGTTTPDQKLEVVGSIKIANSNSRLVFGAENGTDRRALEGNTSGSLLQIGESYTDIALQGDVGIGTTSPTYPLTLSGGAANTNPGTVEAPYIGEELAFKIENPGWSSTNGLIRMIQPAGSYVNNASMTFSTLQGSLTEKMRIENNGNVGISTTGPLGRLDVYRAAGQSGTAAIVISNGEAGSGRNWGISTEVVAAGDFAILTSTTNGGTPVPTLANVRFRINNTGDALFYREILAATTTGTTVRVSRNLFVTYGGSSYDYTFDPVALFGANKSGGKLILEVTGWPSRLNCGYIVWRNNGGGSSKIGTGTVDYVQTAVQSAGNVAVSLPSVNTNEIKISFTGWHTNDHGWSCYIKNDF